MRTANKEEILDTQALELAVKAMYSRVAEAPRSEFHFELGRGIAERLGYDPRTLDVIPAEAIESFAGVGCHFGLAGLVAGESVIDLGSGSGMDCFYASQLVGRTGAVWGVDMTDAQLDKSNQLRDEADLRQVRFAKSYIEQTPFGDESFDCVISNGVINLVADKAAVFAEAYRLLRPGGRLAISDIVTSSHLPPTVTCDANLWAACIGGAMHRRDYVDAVTAAGFTVRIVQLNDYEFKAGRAQNASNKYGVSSISLYATKDA